MPRKVEKNRMFYRHRTYMKNKYNNNQQVRKKQKKLPTDSISSSLNNDWQKIGVDMWQSFHTIESQKPELKHHRNDND